MLAALCKNPQCAEIALEHAHLLSNQTNSRHKEDDLWFTTTLLLAFEMMLADTTILSINIHSLYLNEIQKFANQ